MWLHSVYVFPRSKLQTSAIPALRSPQHVFMKFISTGEWSFHIGIVRLCRCLSPSNHQSCLEYEDWKFAFSCAVLWALLYRGRETLWIIPEVFVRAEAFIWKKKNQIRGDPFPFDFPPKSSMLAPDILPSGRIPRSGAEHVLHFQVLLLLAEHGV